jgi:hypothetical protein
VNGIADAALKMALTIGSAFRRELLSSVVLAYNVSVVSVS